MSLGRGLFRNAIVQVPSPVRPSTFHEDVAERTIEPVPEFEDDPANAELDSPDDYGYHDTGDKPVGVYVTSPIPSDRPLYDWTAATVTIGAVSANIASADRNRKRFVVKNNDDANRVYLLRDQYTATMLGYALEPGQDVELLHTASVWAVAPAGDAELTYVAEYLVEEPANEEDEK